MSTPDRSRRFKSRKHRDTVNANVMKDPRMAGMTAKTMPFDAMRMFWGGFTATAKRASIKRQTTVSQSESS